jgi:acyl-CoA synthetase (NDP forming)
MVDDALPLDVTGRALALRDVALDRFLHPRSIAVVGASDAGAKPNTLMTARLKTFADLHGARFHPVTPVYREVQGVPTVAAITDVDDEIDLAVLLTGADRVVDHFAAACEVGAKFAVIFSAGFSEVDEHGAALEARLAEIAARGPTRLLGPNTNLNAFSDFRTDLDGPAIALITQSGHQGRPIFQGQDLGIRLSHWAPTGNEVDLEFADWCRYFADQPEVGVIAAYIEGFKDGRTLMLAADHAARAKKPIVMVKVGRTPTGASMALSHTGHLTGSDVVTDAVFRQFGITRVDGLDELLDVSATFARTSRPRGKNVCIYAISGGTGAHLADLAAAAGLHISPLSASTQEALHDGLIPEYLRVSNPVDCGGPPVTDARGRKILDILVQAPEVDALIVPITGALDSMSHPMTRDLVDVAATTDKPVFVIWGSPIGDERAYRETLLGSNLPVYRTFQNCVRSVKAWFDWWDFVDRYESPFATAANETTASPSASAVADVIATQLPGPTLAEHASKRVLDAYGIATTRDRLVASADDAASAAAELGFPVVMKVASPDLAHKSDARLVILGVDSATAARHAYDELVTRASAADSDARLDGVLVCEMVTGGIEVLVGISTDELFGPVVSVALGGVLVEVLGDASVRVPPFDAPEAHRMIDELAGRAVLRGARGRDAVDENALVDVIMNVQRLAMEYGDTIAELDINPLLVQPHGAVALDALVVRRQ